MTPPPRLVAALTDRYAFERELGQGGMATVYLADDLKHERKVAIKVLRPELAATIGPERFLREIRIAAQLQHPHILPLLESGEAEGFLYYVMPFVDGQSLRDRLGRQGELPVHEAVKLLAEIVDALSYAHGRAVVHRDVKPDNVMLSGRHALVMDFGVAKAVSEASGRNQLTTAGVALGTPAYMAPEQAAADPHLDHRVDIYAVGAMAYELLAGRPPFVGGTPHQVLAAHVTQAPEPLSRHRPGISSALEATVMRCLAKRPADRWQSAEELLAQLEPLVTPSGGMTPTGTRPIEGWKPASRRPVWIGLAAAGVVALAAAAWALRPSGRAVELVQLDRTQLTFTGNARAPSLSPDGKRIAFAERRCDSAGICLLDIAVQDVGGAGKATIVSGAYNVWSTGWTGDGRYLVVGASFPEGWGNFAVPTLGGGGRRNLGQGRASMIGGGDTVLVTWLTPRDSVAWLRRVSTADGAVHDSIPLAVAKGVFPVVDATPDGRWLVIYSEPESRATNRATLLIADRSGQARDSMVFPHDRIWRVLPLPGSRSVVAFATVEGGLDQADAIVFRFDENGRLDERPDTVARRLQLDNVSLGAGGELVTLAGPLEFSVWSFRRDDPRAAKLSAKRLAASTSIQVTGSISPDGEQIFLARDLGSTGRGLRQLSIMPSDSGPERMLGNPLPIVDWDWGDRDLVAALRNGDSITIGTLSATSGRFSPQRNYHSDEYGTLEAIPGGGFVFIPPNADRVHRVLAGGLPDTTFVFPRSFGFILAVDPSPDGRALATVGWDLEGDRLMAHRVSLIDGSFVRLASFGGENIQTPRWLPDGSLLVPVQETAWTLALYRVPAGGGQPVRLGTLPRIPASYRFAADGRRGIIRSVEGNTDVVVIRNFGEVVR